MTTLVVFDIEDPRGPMPLGIYERTDEDVVIYLTSHAGYRAAPCDCVKLVPVDVFGAPHCDVPDTGEMLAEDVAARAFRVAVDAAANTITTAAALYGPGHSVRA